MSSRNNESDGDHVCQQKGWNIKEIDEDGAQSHSQNLNQRNKPDPPMGTDSVTATMTSRSLDAADNLNANNTIRSFSAAPVATVTSAAVTRSMPVYKDQVLERDNIDIQRSAGAVPVQTTGTNDSHLERLPVYKDQAIPGQDIGDNAYADNFGQPTYRDAVHGDRVTDKNTVYSTGTVPTGNDSFAPPSLPSLTTTEIEQHLLVATVVPDSVANAASSGNVVTAVPANTGHCWKLLLGMVLIVLTVIAVIGGVCGTGGCFSSPGPTVAPPHGSQPQSTVMTSGSPQSTVLPAESPQSTVTPTVSRSEQMTSSSNNTQSIGDWEFCLSSSQCGNGCCSKEYSDDGKLKCTPLTGGYNPSICVGGSGGLGDWAFCSSNSECNNGCCSSKYSNDNKTKCTPLSDGGFNTDICTGAGGGSTGGRSRH
jgi:hypothetical protein